MENKLDLKKAFLAFANSWRLLDQISGNKYQTQEAFARTLTLDCSWIDEIGIRTMAEHLRGILGAFRDYARGMLPDLALDSILIAYWNTDVARLRNINRPRGIIFEERKNREVLRAWISNACHYFWDRRFFITSSNTIGLAPQDSSEGDTICIPLGCRHPMILRKIQDHYIVISEAYVDGYMFGKAMEMLDLRSLELEEFEVQ